MKNINRFLWLFFANVLCISLIACGKPKEEEFQKPAETPAQKIERVKKELEAANSKQEKQNRAAEINGEQEKSN